MKLCENGIHFFKHLVFALDYFVKGNEVAEVEVGDYISDTFKACTNKCTIIRIIPYSELQSLIDNKNNSGDYNSKDRNSGNRNSGILNSGNRNSGNRNSGDYNSGYYNSGYYNSGNHNSGNGYRNFFCTKTKYFLFDIEVKSIPIQILDLNMDWFSLDQNQSYKESWSKCPENILNILKSIPEFKIPENQEKFFEITGIRL